MIWVEEGPLQRMRLPAQTHFIKVLLLASWLHAGFKGKLVYCCFWRDSAHIFRFQDIIEHVYWVQSHWRQKKVKKALFWKGSDCLTSEIVFRRSETQTKKCLSSQWHMRLQSHCMLPPMEMRLRGNWMCLSASGWRTGWNILQ